jgi:cation diffusion facilitator CzcD-associated flavoprotein CzcO
MYRFHPSVRFCKGYPDRQGILRELTQLWKKYDLDERTTFGVSVEKIWQDEKSGKWIVQDPSYGTFDGIIAAVGTCGDPKVPHISGQESYNGTICHSSKLTGQNLKGKSVIVIGGGASALEAVSDAVREGAGKIVILSRVSLFSFAPLMGFFVRDRFMLTHKISSPRNGLFLEIQSLMVFWH